MTIDLTPVQQFLACPTPMAWVDAALTQLDVLLLDHAACEKKAAASALNLMSQYGTYPELLHKMSRLAREELRHFEQVLAIIAQRGISLRPLPIGRYAKSLRQVAKTQEPEKLIDLLIIGAFIEARSCERFAALAPYLEEDLKKFYTRLLQSESRHFQDYLDLAQLRSQKDISARVQQFRDCEAELIQSPDPLFYFHSGVPEK